MSKYVIVGNSAAAIGAIEGIRMVDKQGKITVISEEVYFCYSRPLISYFLAGKVDGEKLFYRGKDFYDKNHVYLHLGTRGVKVNPGEKTIELEDGACLSYGKLLIATGSSPAIPPVKGLGKKGQHFFYNLGDVYSLRENLKGKETAVVVGGGLIGLKAAEALSLCGVKVTVVERSPYLLSSILNERASRILEERIKSSGIRVVLGNTAEEITGEKEVEGVVLCGGEEINCNILVLAAGVKPNIEVLEGTGVTTGAGVQVNNRMQTTREDIYAAGDVAEGEALLTKGKKVIPIWPSAYCQGLVAGKNMAGFERECDGEFPRNSISFFGLNIITAGLLEVSDKGREIINIDPQNSTYQRILIDNDRVMGMIKIGEVNQAGIITWLIKNKIPAGSFKDLLKRIRFNPIHLPLSIRERLYREEGAQDESY